MTDVALISASGPRLGIGHRKRMALLAKELQMVGLTTDCNDIPEGANLTKLLRIAIQGQARAAVVDLPPSCWNDQLESSLEIAKSRGLKLAICDRNSRHADVIIEPSFISNPKVKRFVDKHNIEHAWGWDAAMVSPLVYTKHDNPGGTNLVLTGGADIFGLSHLWPAEINKELSPCQEITWVKGPFASAPLFPPGQRLRWNVLKDIRDLAPLMITAKTALTVFGVSALELMAARVPTVIYSPYGHRDDFHLDFLRKVKVALVTKDRHEAIKLFDALVRNSSIRHQLIANCTSHVNPQPQKLALKLLEVFDISSHNL